MQKKQSKFSICPHCQRSIERHHVKQHEKKCFLSYSNMQHIANFFLKGLLSPKLLKRKTFHKYCVKQADILSPVTMSNYFNQKRFKFLSIQLLIILYKFNLFDWEYAEIIISHINNNNFYMDNKLFNQIKKNTRKSRGLNDIDTLNNYTSLLKAVENRAVLDLNLEVGGKNENNEVVTQECVVSAIKYLIDINKNLVVKNNETSQSTKLLIESF